MSYVMLKILFQIKILKEKQLKKEVLELCTRSFTQSLKLLCIYTIEKQSLANNPLTVNDVNSINTTIIISLVSLKVII